MGRILTKYAVDRWLPWTIFLFGLSGTLMLWGALVKQQRQGVIDTIKAEVKSIEHEFQTLVTSQISELQRAAREWEIHGKPEHARWQTIVKQIVHDHHGLEAVCTADKEGHLLTIDASTLPRETLDKLIEHEQKALAEAGKTGSLSVVKPSAPKLHGHGFVVNVPVGKGESLEAFLVGFFQFKHVMNTVLKNNVDDLEIQIIDRGQVAYENRVASTNFRPLAHPLRVFGSEWTMLCRPTPSLLAREASNVVNLVLVIGAVICWLLAVTVGLMIKARLREARVVNAKDRLAYYSAIVQNSQDAIITTTRDGEITKWNESAETLYGYKADEVIGEHICILDPPNRPVEEDEKHARACAGEWVPSYDAQRLMKDGTRIDISLNESPIVLHGEIVGVSHISRDISERRQTEAALEENATLLKKVNDALNDAYHKAEAATQAKSDFLANMSHEIRTPLTAILGYAEIAAQFVSHEEAIDAVTTIKRNGSQLLEIINDILDLSTIESDRLELNISPVELDTTLRDIVKLMQIRAREKGLPLDLKFTGQIPAVIPCDEKGLRQILINLLSNAIKFTESGFVQLEASFDQSSRRLSLHVTDTGAGMSEDHIKGLFTAFNQADNSPTRKHGGTGLGLTICKRRTEMLGGSMAVESEPNRGSRFTVQLPLPNDVHFDLIEPDAEPQSEAAKSVEEMDNGKTLNCRILLAEDGPDNQRLLAFVLRRAGAHVTVVENGKLAVEQGLGAMPGHGRREGDPDEPYDLVVMDMQMPVMNGYDATRHLREHGFDQPIIALTAHGMQGDRDKCLEAGCTDYATKPIKANELVALIAKHNKQVEETV